MIGRHAVTGAARLSSILAVLWLGRVVLRAQEFRALWVDAFGPGFKTSAQVTDLIRDLRAGNFNAVVVEIRKRGDAYYNGNFEPRATDISAGFDPLADLIAKAHDTNAGARIEVHTWIVTYNIWNNRTTPPPQPDHPYNLHRDWLTQTQSGTQWDGGNYAFDPGHPGVQEHTFNVAMDIIYNYDIDGFNWDYIRYAGPEWGYNPVSVARFNARYGTAGSPAQTDPLWMQFRRDQVTALVRKVYLSAIALKPHVKMSADTITWGTTGVRTIEEWPSSAAYSSVLQDWRGWMEEGIIDLNIPMNYYRQHLHASAFTNWSVFARDHKYNRHLAIGPGIYLNGASNAIVQMRHALLSNTNGNRAEGVCGYSHRVPNTGDVSRATFLNALTQPSALDPVTPPIFAQPATPPVMPWKTNPTRGHLKGFVLSGTNQVDGATVTLRSATNKVMMTDATGFYGAVDLPPGSYGLSASSTNLGAAFTNLTITAGVVTHIDLRLSTNDVVPPLLLDVRAIDISDSSARVTWRTDEMANSIVDYGTTTNYTHSTTDAALVTTHEIDLASLAPNTTYHFRVRSEDARGNSASSSDHTFTTNPRGVVSDLIVDNRDASVAGAWTTGVSSVDKYGPDYQYTGPGTGAEWLQFTPRILTAGQYKVYEWHPQGSNRTTNAPCIIRFSGGTQTFFVNQKVNGGRWNLLGTLSFAAGTNGYVRITDGFPDTTQVVLADAIKFAYVPPGRFESITLLPDGRVRLLMNGDPDSMYVLQSSTDFVNWSTVTTLQNSSGRYEHVDIAAGNRFYRLRTP